ncbi:hypothetical protein SSX86_010002 [Deinandra increscens subsp. villosa]|uniref:Uncharacterized protein n=1 Tax=Deinandra increscens subsp. villosa TaxID=3103831 RepID=A0AAP0DEF3_9ASTR
MELRNSRVESSSLDRSQPIQKPEDGGLEIQAVAAADVGNAGGGVGVVKRKRGRPPKAQVSQPVAKKSREEEEEEDVCFICFDGGSLVLCDRRGCPKAYHPACIKRDEAFFRSKAKWNCGWHICSICEKTSYHMCYTCTYSLCKGCIRKADFVCVRGDKGFCTVCMRTIMLIENSGDASAQVDFDDKTSWEYLFKVYWVYLKGKLSLTFDDLKQATNPWKLAPIEPASSHISVIGRRSITSELSLANLEANESKRRKTNEQTNGLPNDPSMNCPKEWANKELLDFVAHMKNGDTTVLSQFDVQALLLEYINRNNLRDPQKKSQIICDLRLMNLFGKPRVGHIEMLKLLETHFLVKEDPQKHKPNSTLKHGDTDCKTENTVVAGNKERRNHRKGGKRITQNKLEEYAAIDVHNMNLIYLRRSFMESLIEDKEKFHEKAVGSIVQIRISGSDQKDDMYRLVQVVGTTKVNVPYKIGDKLVDVMLEVLNLDKKETVSIDTISNQELSEDECRRLRESIKCGLVRCFTVGEIQEKAMALQSVLLDDRIKNEMLRLNQLHDQASEKGQKKGVRECVQKLKILKTPEERERRLQEIPEVHSDPKMNPDYESDDTEEYFNNEHGDHPKPKFPWVSGTNTISPTKKVDNLNDQPLDLGVANAEGDSSKPKMGKDAIGLSGSGRPRSEAECNGSTVPKCNPEAAVSSSLSNIPSGSTPSFLSIMNNRSFESNMWHYRDPSGNVQGPFSMVQLQKWSTSGYFPADMRIWADREADSLLLNNVLQEHFYNNHGRWPENAACSSKDDNQVETVTVSSEIPSSTIPATSYTLDNSVKLEKVPDDLNRAPPSVASLTKMNESTGQFGIQDVPDINQHVSSAISVADASLGDLPSLLPKKVSHENLKIQDSGAKEQSKLLVHDSGIQNMPDINQHASSVFTVADAVLVDSPIPLQKKKSREKRKMHDSREKDQSKLLAGASLKALAKGAVKFSRRFTFREVRDRWYSLLYDPDVSTQASTHMVELELSVSNPSSKSRLDSLKGSEKVPEKRKNGIIRKHYYAMRKRIKNDFFSSQNLGFFEEHNLQSYNHQEHRFQDNGTTHVNDAMLDDCLANNLGFEEKDFEILLQAFPESLQSISTTATTTTTKVVPHDAANAFHLERCHNSTENDIINESIDVSPSRNELMLKNAACIDKSAPSETPPNENHTKNDKPAFGGKHHFHSPVSDGSASFHTIGGFPSPSTRLPLWKTMEDISAPDMPVDENNAKIHQVAEDMLALHEDESLLGFDGPLLGDRPHGLINCIEYTDSLLNFSNEDDILFIDADGKDTIDEVNQEVDLCSADPKEIPSNHSPEESKDSSCHQDQHEVCHQELTEGKIICTLSTEDPDIPCNDDIFLLIHPSTQFAPPVGLKTATDSIGPLSSSSHEKDGEQGRITVRNGNDPPSFTRSVTGGLNVLPEFVSPHSLAESAFKCKPPDGEYLPPPPGKPNNLRNPSQTMPIHTPLEISGNGRLEEDARKVKLQGLSSSPMYREMPFPLEVGSVKIMTDLESIDGSYVGENNSDSDGHIPYFSDVEAMILEMDLANGHESSITSEVARYQNEDGKRMIRRLEQAARSSFQRLMSSHGALAVFYGRRLKHYIKKAEVTIGRSTNDTEVDIDLRKEGRANKISRRQAIIKMGTDGSFSLKNLGTSSVSLNGKEVAHGQVVALASSCLIEIRGMSFVFEINDKYVRRFLSNKPS